MKNIIFYLLISLSLLASPTSFADSQGMSKQQAASIAQKQHPGRVLSVKRTNGGYVVKILGKDGSVRQVHVNGKGGNQSRGR